MLVAVLAQKLQQQKFGWGQFHVAIARQALPDIHQVVARPEVKGEGKKK